MKYSIVIPCYNESENLSDLVDAIKKVPDSFEAEFILVENGSIDNSREIFKNINVKNMKLVYVDKNQGYGYGIIQGLKESIGDFVGWIHADMQYNPIDLIPFFEYINFHEKEKLLLKGKRKNRKFIEYFFTFGMNIYDSLLFKEKMKEVMSMPVIFNKELLKFIDSFPYDYSIDIFIYALALKLNYNIVHLPIYLKKREKGHSSWNNGFISRIKQSKKMIVASQEVKKELKYNDRYK